MNTNRTVGESKISTIKQVSKVQWDRLIADFPGLEDVWKNCFRDPRYCAPLRNKAWPLGLSKNSSGWISFAARGGREKIVGRPDVFGASTTDWDRETLQDQPSLIKTTGGGLLQFCLTEFWLILNNGSRLVLNCKAKAFSPYDNLEVEGEPLVSALVLFLSGLFESVRIDCIVKAEFFLEGEEHTSSRLKKGLRLTAFRRPKNENWLNPGKK